MLGTETTIGDVGTQDNESCTNYCESGETSVLDEGYIGCYNNDDLQFLEDLIINSTGSNAPSSDLSPWMLGYQNWEDRRLKSFCCSDKDLSTIPQLAGSLLSCDEDCPYSFNTEIPSNIGNLNQLTTLDLSQNDLNGSIPSEFGNLGDLVRLELQHNNFNGSIPSEFGNSNSLTYLNYLYLLKT